MTKTEIETTYTFKTKEEAVQMIIEVLSKANVWRVWFTHRTWFKPADFTVEIKEETPNAIV